MDSPRAAAWAARALDPPLLVWLLTDNLQETVLTRSMIAWNWIFF